MNEVLPFQVSILKYLLDATHRDDEGATSRFRMLCALIEETEPE